MSFVSAVSSFLNFSWNQDQVRYIAMCYLTLFATNYSLCQHLASTILNDIVYVSGFKKKAGRNGQETEGMEEGGCVGSQRKFVKCDENYLLMVHCDDLLKHDRLLTLIRLFEYRNTGTRVLLVHDDKHTTIHTGSNNSCI